MDVVAEYFNTNSIFCVTPYTTVGVAKIGISNNGVDFEYSGSTFTFGNLPNIDSLSRRNVSVYGSNRIYLRGPNFLNDTINCRIEVPYLHYTKEYIVKGTISMQQLFLVLFLVLKWNRLKRLYLP